MGLDRMCAYSSTQEAVQDSYISIQLWVVVLILWWMLENLSNAVSGWAVQKGVRLIWGVSAGCAGQELQFCWSGTLLHTAVARALHGS
jgi:hypothetical protein